MRRRKRTICDIRHRHRWLEAEITISHAKAPAPMFSGTDQIDIEPLGLLTFVDGVACRDCGRIKESK